MAFTQHCDPWTVVSTDKKSTNRINIKGKNVKMAIPNKEQISIFEIILKCIFHS